MVTMPYLLLAVFGIMIYHKVRMARKMGPGNGPADGEAEDLSTDSEEHQEG